MKSQIEPTEAAAIVAELSKSLRGTHTLRLETDTLVKCQTKIVRTRKNIVGEEPFLVHQTDDEGHCDVNRLEDMRDEH